MQRRSFLTLLGGVAAAWPLAGAAQQPKKVPKIGVLVTSNPEPFWTLFKEGLRDRGYVEGRSIQFEYRSADGNLSRLPEYAGELIRLKVDIIVATQTPAVIAARQATTEIPIVSTSGDPLATGLISSLARPGGNITGVSATSAELSKKLLELVREVVPFTKRVAALANAPDPFSRPFIDHNEEGGQFLRIAIQTMRVRAVDDLDAMFASMEQDRPDAIIVQPSLPRQRVIDLALLHRLPAFGSNTVFAREGGLIAYAANQRDLYRRAAYYVERILNGAKPVDLPVEQPTRYDLSVNLKTAKALGIVVPYTVLARADEVIE
jgi:ABC-type uncharacterized transport system substrate-binding protein